MREREANSSPSQVEIVGKILLTHFTFKYYRPPSCNIEYQAWILRQKRLLARRVEAGRGLEGSGDRLSLAAFGVRLIEAVECESEVSARSTSQRPSTVSILRIGRKQQD